MSGCASIKRRGKGQLTAGRYLEHWSISRYQKSNKHWMHRIPTLSLNLSILSGLLRCTSDKRIKLICRRVSPTQRKFLMNSNSKAVWTQDQQLLSIFQLLSQFRVHLVGSSGSQNNVPASVQTEISAWLAKEESYELTETFVGCPI